MSRSRTRERRQQREQQRKRQRQMLLLGVIAVVVVLAVVFLVLASLPADATLPEETIARYADVPQSVGEAGFPVLGNPDAPVQVVEYSSFDCPACGRFYNDAINTLIERAAAGEIAFTYVPLYGTGSIPNGEGAARAAVCAGEQNAFWPYHSALFSWQEAYGNAAFASNRLAAAVDSLGLDRGAWDACMSSSRPDVILNAAIDAARTVADFQGTPTIVINGINTPATVSSVNSAIDAALATAPVVVPPVQPDDETGEPDEPAPEEAEAEATEEASE
jgi:protein-disulfide isomerase